MSNSTRQSAKKQVICLACNTIFDSYNPKRKYCNKECEVTHKINSGSKYIKKEVNCLVCEKQFTSYNPTPKYCSLQCKSIHTRDELHCKPDEVIAEYKSGKTIEEVATLFNSTRKVVYKILSNSGTERRVAAKRDQYGEKNTNWNGGKTRTSHGYIRCCAPFHPMKDSSGTVMEHRLVMESHIGRYLEEHECVHHINFIKDDNRIENLALMTKSEHTALHNKLRVGK